MNSTIQKQKPIRTCIKTYKNYGLFKKNIVEDFNNRCGYCDDLDKFNGGKNNYQIDHFKPKKLFLELETEYSNLVYCCPFCNRAKWDKWKPNGFIDPCTGLYDEHLERNHNGEIRYKSLRGKYIYENLNLYLKRHELLWMIEKLQEQSNEIDIQLTLLDDGHVLEVVTLREFRKIQQEINRYTNLFYSEI